MKWSYFVLFFFLFFNSRSSLEINEKKTPKANTILPEINKSKIQNSQLNEYSIEEKIGKSPIYGNLKEQEPVFSEKEIDDLNNEKTSQMKSERIILPNKAQEKKNKFDSILSKPTRKNENNLVHFENKKELSANMNMEFVSSDSHMLSEERNQNNPI